MIRVKTHCDMCGKKFDIWDKLEEFKISHEIGYGSKHGGDYVSCDLCCDCFDKLLDEYLIPNCKHRIVYGD